jgi:hypothetical protein
VESGHGQGRFGAYGGEGIKKRTDTKGKNPAPKTKPENRKPKCCFGFFSEKTGAQPYDSFFYNSFLASIFVYFFLMYF